MQQRPVCENDYKRLIQFNNQWYHDSKINPSRGLIEHSLDWETNIAKLLTFLKTKSLEKAKAASILLHHTTYIDYITFTKDLLVAFKSFETQIANEPYLIVLYDELDRGKSSYWVSHVLLQLITQKKYRLPVNCVPLSLALRIYPNIKQWLFVDDAAYTGMQMSETIGMIGKLITQCIIEKKVNRPKPIISIVFAACSDEAKNNILEEAKREAIQTQIFRGKTLFPLRKGLTSDEAETLAPFVNMEKFPYLFVHKIPDGLSSYPWFYQCGMITGDKEEPTQEEIRKECYPIVTNCKDINCFQSPYHTLYKKTIL